MSFCVLFSLAAWSQVESGRLAMSYRTDRPSSVIKTTYEDAVGIATGTVGIATDTALVGYACLDEAVRRRLVLALHTNLLVPGMNFGFEVPIGRRWSIGGDYYYPWQWRKSDMKDCFQLTFFSAEARYWLGRPSGGTAGHRTSEYWTNKGRTSEDWTSEDRTSGGNRPVPGGFAAGSRLLGHSVGAYAAWGYYDFERDFSGHQGDIWSAGIDYVYALPLRKSSSSSMSSWRLEFQFALGFIHSKAHPYDVFEEGGHLINRRDVHKRFNYFGPTKVGVSLVLPITRPSKQPLRSSKKGGRR